MAPSFKALEQYAAKRNLNHAKRAYCDIQSALAALESAFYHAKVPRLYKKWRAFQIDIGRLLLGRSFTPHTRISLSDLLSELEAYVVCRLNGGR